MAKTPHPKFPNPTIAEALCELEITPAESSKWRITRPTSLLKILEPDFPEFEPVTNMGIQIRVGPSGPQQEMVSSPARLKFSSEDKKRIVQATDTVFTFNFLDPYPGWDAVSQSILSSWEKVSRVVEPKEVIRVGLRYINKIPRTQEHPKLSDWLKPTRHLSQGIIESSDPFLSRIEARPDERSRMVVTLSMQTVAPPEAHPPSIVFDIDRHMVGATRPDVKTIGAIIESLHDDAWEEFQSAMTPRLKAFLEAARQ